MSYAGYSLFRVLSLYRDAVGIFYSPSQLGFIYEGELKSLYNDDIFAVDDFWGQWDRNTATPMKKCVYHKERQCWKNKLHLVTFHESILVSQWNFQPTLVKHFFLLSLVLTQTQNYGFSGEKLFVLSLTYSSVSRAQNMLTIFLAEEGYPHPTPKKRYDTKLHLMVLWGVWTTSSPLLPGLLTRSGGTC